MRRVEIGVVVLAVLGLLDVLSPWLTPPPPEAPPFVDALSIALGVLTWLFLAVWGVRRSRGALWGAVVVRVLSALQVVPAFLDGVSGGILVAGVVLAVATVVGIALVAPALGRSRVGA
jgi:hypothetical protein